MNPPNQTVGPEPALSMRHTVSPSGRWRRGDRAWSTRKGATLVMFALFAPVFLLLISFVLELGRVRYIKNQLQSAADAGALAGASRLRLTSSEMVSTSFSLLGEGGANVRPTAQAVVAANRAAQLGPDAPRVLCVEDNLENILEGDIVVGNFKPSTGFLPDATSFNSVKVTVRFKEDHPNRQLPLFFGSILDLNFVNLDATAVCRVERPTLLPFVLYQGQWDALMGGKGSDQFTVDTTNSSVTVGGDGILETTVFPGPWDGADLPPGNFGWFDLGINSTTEDLKRHVDEGPNAAEMEAFGGSINAGDWVSGATGLHTATEVAFVGGADKRGRTAGPKGQTSDTTGLGYEGIIGKARLIALYDDASGNGNNARFRITKFVLARVVATELRGGSKTVVVQPLVPPDDPHRIRLVQ